MIRCVVTRGWGCPTVSGGQVELVVGFTERGELTYASLSVVLADVGVDRFLSQTHSLRFEV